MLFMLLFLQIFCQKTENQAAISSSKIKVKFNSQLYSLIQAEGKNTNPLMEEYQKSEYLLLEDMAVKNFALISSGKKKFKDIIGSGKMLLLKGLAEKNGLKVEKIVKVKIYNDFPDMAVFNVTYINKSSIKLPVRGWVNNRYKIIGSKTEKIPFWSFQSGTYEDRRDWVLPLKHSFYQKNYMGMNASDYGGGTPVSDVWRKDAGLAVGHLEKTPKLVSLPVKLDSLTHIAEVSVEYKKKTVLAPGDSLSTLTTFVSVHKGDYFHTLVQFSNFMRKQGVSAPEFPETAYQPVWCAWGYERNFTVNQVLNTLPEVKKLGFKWAVLDDGWQTAEGDWYLNPEKFPRGDADMRAFVDKIHAYGLKAKLWFVPLAADPGTDLLKNHSDMLLLNKDGTKQLITWWDSYYMCPAFKPAIEYTQKLIKKILIDWDFDGLKLDGQNQNAVPPCYNPAHNHAYPEESVEKLPQFFKMIYETAVSVKPDAVVEICPCGTASSFYNMAYMNQPVSSDPVSSWQIRLKGKTYKALMGPDVPYYGDHVELSDGKDDFASTVGIGGVPGSKFVWPVGVHNNRESGDISLTPEKEKEWSKWIEIYNKNELPKGEYLGELYDIGFDIPEAHVIKKGDTLFYAFYADKWNDLLELKGLKNKTYQVYDYVNNKDYGRVSGSEGKIRAEFRKYLLLKAVPEN
ncbi:alpha-galactosidase [bacterium]|nr:alpha-galactosidase [bacterium]